MHNHAGVLVMFVAATACTHQIPVLLIKDEQSQGRGGALAISVPPTTNQNCHVAALNPSMVNFCFNLLLSFLISALKSEQFRYT